MNVTMESSKFKLYATSVALAVGCAGFAYVQFRRKYGLRKAEYAFNYMKINKITTEELCDEVVNELRKKCKSHRAIGFDCEWVTENGKRQPVALVQLSTLDGYSGLFRLSKIGYLPKSLKDLLEDETIYKVGVAATDDAKYLQMDYSVILKSSLDLRHLAELCGHSEFGLAALTKSLLNIVLDKSWRIRCSNWEADVLTDRQIKYAAADAHVAIKIFVQLVEKYNRIQCSSWLSNGKSKVWANLDDLCWKYADVNFKNKKKNNKDNLNPPQDKKPKKNKDIKISKKYSHTTRSKPLYNNCSLEAPDGELLCTCDNKKALWYVDKGLADKVSEDPLIVRLSFEPSGRSVGDVGKYYQLVKENKCVVCGATNSYIRKNVVPREYRKYFPEIMKERSSHDVLLLCIQCHQRSNRLDKTMREYFANKCDASFAHHHYNKYFEDPESKKVRHAARALLYQTEKHDVPEKRRKELEEIVLKHYTDHEEVTKELLEEAVKVPVLFENGDYESHGLKVVEHYLEHEGGLLKLEEVWREHFLKSMRPKFLPNLWSVKHTEERLKVKFDEGRLSFEDAKMVGLSKWFTIN